MQSAKHVGVPMFIRPSTRRFFHEFSKLRRYGWGVRLHGYIYGRWLYHYIAIGIGQHPLAKNWGAITAPLRYLIKRLASSSGAPPAGEQPGFADSYHGKVVLLEQARKLVTLNRPITLPDLEKVIPFRRARDLILKNPEHIAALQCPCRSARSQPCLPLDVCLVVGEPFVSFILDHHPDRSRAITQDEAVTILEAEHRRGHVSHAFFKDAMLDRFYAICNCCSCCCGAMQAHRRGTPMLASSGYSCEFDETRCVYCGQCAEICQFGAIDYDRRPLIDQDRCLGCGVCVGHCPEQALTLRRDSAKGEPLEIHRLLAEAGAR